MSQSATAVATDSAPGDQDETQAAGAGPRLGTSLTFLLVALGFAVGGARIGDNSFLTHFTTGDIIRLRGFPSVDPYSYTAPGEPWTVQSWLASLIYSWANEIGGGFALRMVNALLVGVLVYLVRRLTNRTSSFLGGFMAAAVVVSLGTSVWSPRPLLFGLVGLALLWLCLLEGWSPRWLVPVMYVWVNTHGSFPLAFVLIGAVGLGFLLDHRTWPWQATRVLGWVSAGVAIASVNPIGPRLLIFPIELLSRREALEGVGEWARVDFDRPLEWIFGVLLVGLVFALVRRAPFELTIPGLVFAVAGVLAVRNIAVAALVMAPAVAMALSVVRSSFTGDERSFLSRSVAVVAGCAGVIALVAAVTTPALDLDGYPVEAADWMDDNDLIATPEARILQRDIVGNYLHYRFGTEARVFVDDRFDFYPLDLLADHRQLLVSDDDTVLSAIIDRQRPTAILWEADSHLGRWLEASDEWQVLFRQDDDWIVATPV